MKIKVNELRLINTSEGTGVRGYYKNYVYLLNYTDVKTGQTYNDYLEEIYTSAGWSNWRFVKRPTYYNGRMLDKHYKYKIGVELYHSDQYERRSSIISKTFTSKRALLNYLGAL